MLLIGKAPNRRSNNLKVTAAATRQLPPFSAPAEKHALRDETKEK